MPKLLLKADLYASRLSGWIKPFLVDEAVDTLLAKGEDPDSIHAQAIRGYLVSVDLPGAACSFDDGWRAAEEILSPKTVGEIAARWANVVQMFVDAGWKPPVAMDEVWLGPQNAAYAVGDSVSISDTGGLVVKCQGRVYQITRIIESGMWGRRRS